MERDLPRADDLMDTLEFLRKGEGLSSPRLERTPLVIELLRGNGDESDQRIMSRFVSAIDSLGGSDSELLRAIYGVDDGSEPSLTGRRRVYSRQIGRGVDTIASREKDALARLARALTRGTYPQSPLVIDVPEMHDGLVYESASALIVIENRIWRETHERYKFVAEFDEMDLVTITRSYAAQASTPAGGQFRVNTRPASKGFNDHFWHIDAEGRDEPMYRGQPYDLRFRLKAKPELKVPMVNAYRAFHHRSLFASIQVQFIGPQPDVAWKYERVSHFAQPGLPTDANQVNVDAEGMLSLRLRDVHGGLVSGLAWRW